MCNDSSLAATRQRSRHEFGNFFNPIAIAIRIVVYLLGEVAHQGGQVLDRDKKYYNLVHQWIRGGAKL